MSDERWKCDICGASGRVEIPDHADFMTGYNLVTRDHMSTSPNCGDCRYIRVADDSTERSSTQLEQGENLPE